MESNEFYDYYKKLAAKCLAMHESFSIVGYSEYSVEELMTALGEIAKFLLASELTKEVSAIEGGTLVNTMTGVTEKIAHELETRYGPLDTSRKFSLE